MSDATISVLLIEDNPGDARLIRELLAEVRGEPFVVEHANRLSLGLARLADAPIDIVLSDLGLPDSQGLDTFTRVHAQAPQVPIIVLTGTDDETLAVAAVRAGAQDYLVKGQVNSDSLARAIRYAVERKHTQEAVRESEDRYRDLVEHSQDLICTHDLTGRILSANQTALRALGYAPEELVNKNLLDFMPPGSADGLRAYLADINEHHVASGLLRVQSRDGQTHIWEYNNNLRQIEGEPSIVRGMARDVTERVKAEKALRASEQRYQTLAETAPIGIFRTDPQGQTNYVNSRWCEIAGLQASQALGDGWLSAVHPADRDQIVIGWQQATHDQTSSATEYRFLRPDGTVAWVMGKAVPEKDASGKIVSYIGTITDITERKRAEQELQQRADEFAALYEVTRDLAAQPDVDALLKVIVQRATELFATPSGTICLYDPARDDLVIAAVKGPELPVGTRIKIGEGAAGVAAQTRAPLIVADYSRWEHRLPQYAANYFGAAATVPMLYGGTLIGTLNVVEPGSSPRQFTEADVRLLTLFAGLAAAAVHNARLLDETEHRADEFAALYEISRDLTLQMDWTRLLQTISAKAMTLLDADSSLIYLYDPAADEIELAVALGLDMPLGTRLAMGEGVSGQVAKTHAPVRIDNYKVWDQQSPKYLGLPIAAVLAVPMIYSGQLIGVLGVSQSKESAHQFSDADERLLGLFAAQAASTVYNARLLQQAHEHAEQLGLLYDASLALNQILDPRAQIEFLLKVAKQSLRSDRAEFFQWDERTERIALQSGIGFSQEVSKHPLDRRYTLDDKDSVVGWVAKHRTLLNLPEVALDPRYIAFDPAVRSGMWAPAQHEKKLLGIIALLSTRPNAFSAQDEQLLMLFANQIAVALENARLFEAEQARRKELTALYNLARALADTDDFNKILNLTAQNLVESCQITFGYVLLIEQDAFVAQAAFPARMLERDLALGRRDPIDSLAFCQRAVEESKPLIVRATDAAITESERQRLTLGIAQSLCLIPWRVGEKTMGVWVLGEARAEEREPFHSEKLRLASSIIEQSAGAVERNKLHEQTERRLNQLQALNAIDQAITASFEVRIPLNIMLEQAVTQLGVDAARLLILSPQTHVLECVAARGFRSRTIEQTRERLGEGYAGRVVLERRSIQVANLPAAEDAFARAELFKVEKFVFYQGVPLIAKGQVKGVLELFHHAPLTPNPEWLDFAETLAGQAAIAIEGAELFANLQHSNVELANAYDATLEGWSRALDLRDKETEGHTLRVTKLAMQLAGALGVGEDELVNMHRGALLHDIGKMGVPDGILLKTGALTDEEWVIMRKHPTYAYQLLSPITYLRQAIEIPYCHHEKYDGTGYPRGLKGEEIPFAARIFAVADVWDAVRSDRPYRKAWTVEKARAYILANSGMHFDPEVVEAFLRLVSDPPIYE